MSFFQYVVLTHQFAYVTPTFITEVFHLVSSMYTHTHQRPRQKLFQKLDVYQPLVIAHML